MTTEKFSDLWNHIGNIAKDIETSCQGEIHFCEQKKSYIQYEYDKFRNHCKEHLKSIQKTTNAKGQSDESTPLLDRHKVASCIAGAILSTQPMEICLTTSKNKFNLTYFANESLALFSALGIVKSYIRSDNDNLMKLNLDLKGDFLQNGFIFPQPAQSAYLPWLLFILQECSQIGFNALSFSNILYLLETYTFDQLEIIKLRETSKKGSAQ